jgi:sensor histidine kinase YesM
LRNLGLVIWLLLMASVFEGRSQCVVVDKNLTIKSIKPQLACYIDSTSQHNHQSIQKPTFVNFDQAQFPKFLISEYRYTFWFRFCIENTSNQPQEIVMTMGEIYRQEFWLNDSAAILLSQDKRLAANQYEFDHKYLRYTLQAHQRIKVLVKLNDRLGQQFLLDPHVASLGYEQQTRLKNLYDERWTFWQNIALKTVLLFVALFVFVQYYFVAQKFFLYYGFYVLCMFLFHLHGFMYSSYFQSASPIFSFLKFDVQSNFHVIVTQIFYMLFLREVFNINTKGTSLQRRVFRIILNVFYVLLSFEVFFVFVVHRLDYSFVLALFTQIFIVVISIYLLAMIFTARNFEVLPSIKWASVWLFVGAIWGFASAYFGWARTYSAIFQYYPNFFFNFCVFAEILLYSIAMGQLFTKNLAERGMFYQKATMSELNTLRSQINPHFLFNSLNSVKGLIIKQKPDEAVAFLTDVSSYIRKILHQSREQLLTLAEELEFTDEYLKIEKKRFKDTFDYEIIWPQNPDVLQQYFPALTLQPFVENCLKHAFGHETTSGFIKITVESTNHHYSVVIDDNGIGREASAKLKPANTEHRSVGIKLIEERLQVLNQLYQWDVRFEIIDKTSSSGTIVKISIPFLS